MPAPSRPREDTFMPSATAVAAGIVSPMDIPIDRPIPLLRLKKREYKRRRVNASNLRRFHQDRDVPYVSNNVKRLRNMERLRSSIGLPITSFVDMAQSLQDMDEEFHVAKNMSVACVCRSCKYLRRWSSTLQPYRCKDNNCRIDFESFTDMYEHQLEVHGGLDPRANRVVNDTFHQQRGTLAFPPATVYAGQQYMFPSRPPTPWKSMKGLGQEAKTLRERLWDYNPNCFETPWKLFDKGYKLVKRNGQKEMKRQYDVAMENFYSGMKFLASSHEFHDGCPSVGRGRNWLTSTDREDSRLLYPFSVGDKVDQEPEFVLIDAKRDKEMEEMYSDDSDNEDASTKDKSTSEEEIFKNAVEMKAPEDDDDFYAVKEQKVFEVDSDNDDDIAVKSERDDGKTTAARKAFGIDSDDDSDITVMSEVDDVKDIDEAIDSEDSDSDSDSDTDTGMVLKSFRTDVSDSDSEVELKYKGGVDELVDVSDSDSSSDDEVELKPVDETISDSESDSDSDDDFNPSPVKIIHDVSSSSEDSSDVESEAPKDASNQFVSDSDEEHKTLNSQDDIFNQLE